MSANTSTFIRNMQNLPMWVKQVLASEISEELNSKLADFTTLINGESLFQFICPRTSLKGKQELQTRQMELSEGYYIFLKDCIDAETTIFEITIKNNWSLADSAKIFIRVLELEFITISGNGNDAAIALAGFIANKIKTGEFLKRIGRIDALQLEQAIRYQKQLNDEGQHMKMASILIKMGFITDQGLDSLIKLKEESKRRMPSTILVNTSSSDSPEAVDDNIMRLQREITRLENENLIMKKHLKKLLHVN